VTQYYSQTPATQRFDKVDVLNLIDPHWIENGQAAKLIRMVAEREREEPRDLSPRRETLEAA